METAESPFLFLSLDLPAVPLHQSDKERNIIPQIAIEDLLMKFDGWTQVVRFLLAASFQIT